MKDWFKRYRSAVAGAISGDEECHDDVILPPGGRPRPAPAVEIGSDPCYIDRHGRDLRIDLLRGFFVFAMIVDHVRGQSPLHLLTGGNRFYVSAAEGFILTSGLVAGLVYRRLMERNGMGPTLLKVLQRAGVLYLLTIALTLIILPISELLNLPWAQGIDRTNPLRVLISVLALHQTYYLVDVMLLYTILFLVLPLALVLLERGRTWIVLGSAWLLWGLYQFFPDLVSLPWSIAGNYLFNFSAWQVIFFTGLVLGYRQDRLPLLQRRTTRIALLLTGLGTLILIGLYLVIDAFPDLISPALKIGNASFHDIRLWIQDYVFAKVDLRPGRLIASAIVFSFFFLAVTVFWRQIQRGIGWLLLPLGQHALYGYTAHVILVIVVALALAPFNLRAPGPEWLNALIQIASVLLIWALLQRQVLAPTPRTRSYWYASPALFGFVALLIMYVVPVPESLAQQSLSATASTSRVPSRFGTPIPRDAALTAPQVAATPAPEVPWKTVISADALTRVGEFVDADIKGVLQERWFYSPELDRDMPYWVYLPPDYGITSRRYPVLYMLHGLGGHRDEWIVYGLINVADRAIRNGDILPLIIVLPQGDKGYWVNHVGNGPRWGEYLRRDLVRHIDLTYRTLRAPRARAIGGLSMGGFGALSIAFNHPDQFGVVGAHSASLRADDGSLAFLGSGEEFAARDPIAAASRLPDLDRLRIWIDVSSDDPWLDRADLLHRILAGRQIAHTYQVWPGEHGYVYWEKHMLDYVRFYGHALSHQ